VTVRPNRCRRDGAVAAGSISRLLRVRVAWDTSPGHPRQPNQDFVGAVPGAVVLLDGAGIPGTEDLCHHGVAWYTRSLGGALLARLAATSGPDLVAILADSIEEVTDCHRHTCDVVDPSSPQATVLLLRRSDEDVDVLMLGDSFLVLDRHGAEPEVITDGREVAVRAHARRSVDGLIEGTAEFAKAWERAVAVMRSRRNQTGGYWIAKDDPQAAAQAVTDRHPVSGLAGAALLTNGASRLVDPYEVCDWPDVLNLLRMQGPVHVLDLLRATEAQQRPDGDSRSWPTPDDATAAYWDLVGPT